MVIAVKHRTKNTCIACMMALHHIANRSTVCLQRNQGVQASSPTLRAVGILTCLSLQHTISEPALGQARFGRHAIQRFIG